MGHKDLADKGWLDMTKRLDREMPTNKRKRKKAIWLFFIGLALSLLVLTTFLFIGPEELFPSNGQQFNTLNNQTLNETVNADTVGNKSRMAKNLDQTTIHQEPHHKPINTNNKSNSKALNEEKHTKAPSKVATSIDQIEVIKSNGQEPINDGISATFKSSSVKDEKAIISPSTKSTDVVTDSKNLNHMEIEKVDIDRQIISIGFIEPYQYDEVRPQTISPIALHHITPLYPQNLPTDSKNEVYIQCQTPLPTTNFNGQLGYTRKIINNKPFAAIATIGIGTYSIPEQPFLSEINKELEDDESTVFNSADFLDAQSYLNSLGYEEKRYFEVKVGIGFDIYPFKKWLIRNQIESYLSLGKTELHATPFEGSVGLKQTSFLVKVSDFNLRSFHSLGYQLNDWMSIYGGVRLSITPDVEFGFDNQKLQRSKTTQFTLGSTFMF